MEMEDLSTEARLAKRKQTLAGKNPVPNIYNNEDTRTRDVTTDSTIAVWTYATATWLVMMSIPFLAFPRFLLFLSSTNNSGPERPEYRLTHLERFLLTQLVILALSLSVGIIVSLPADSPVMPPSQSPSPGHPLLGPVTFGLLISAFLSYNTPASQIGPLAFFMALGTGVTGLLGVFALLFSGSSSISRKTGADKRTSRFLFWNLSAASARKKQWNKSKEES